MTAIPLTHGLLLAGGLFVLGMVGLVVRRNIFFILLSLEIMFNAAGLAFVIAGQSWNQVDGQIMFLFILTVAASEVSIGLALVLQLYHHYKTVNVDIASDLRDSPKQFASPYED